MSARAVRAAAVLAVVVLGACGTSPGDGGDGPATPAPSPSSLELPTTPPPTGRTASPGTVQAPGVDGAVADLAAHLGVPADAVTVVSLEEVTWPDGSLGCPQPGMSYTQALVPGQRLVLAAEGREFSYHAGREPEFRRCDRPQPPASTTSPQTSSPRTS